MRMRPTVYRGLLLSLFLALGIALGAPSAAWAQAGPWTTVASAGTADAASLKILTLDGPFAFNSNTGSVATIRYNVVALDNVSGGLPANQDTGFMVVRYRDDGLAAVVRLELIEVNLLTGTSTTKLVFDSDDFPQATGFQTRQVSSCPTIGTSFFNFFDNAYYINATLDNISIVIKPGIRPVGHPALQAIQVFAGPCLS